MPFLAALAAPLALKRAVGALRSIPWQVWAAIALIGLLWLGKCSHDRQVKAFGEEQFQAGVNSEKETTNKLIAELAVKNAKDAAEIRREHEEALRASTALADDLRLRGPGAARCRPIASPAGSSGREPPAGRADASPSGLPPEDWAAVPWIWFVESARICDANRAEAVAWREQHRRLTEANIGTNP